MWFVTSWVRYEEDLYIGLPKSFQIPSLPHLHYKPKNCIALPTTVLPFNPWHVVYSLFLHNSGDGFRTWWVFRESVTCFLHRKEKKRLRKQKGKILEAPLPGIEPGSPAWQAGILTTILQRLSDTADAELFLEVYYLYKTRLRYSVIFIDLKITISIDTKDFFLKNKL